MKYFLPIFLLTFSMSLAAQVADNMEFLGRFDDDSLPQAGAIQFNDVWGYVDCDSTEYALLGSREYVHFLRIEDDGTPTEIQRIPGGQNVTWRDMKTYRNYGYSVCDGCSEGLMIYDLSQVAEDTVILVQQTTEFFSKSHNIYIDELNGRLYSVGTDSMSQGMIVLDLTVDPGNPTLMAKVPMDGGYIHDIHVVDHMVYASHGFNGLFVYDATDATSPVFLGSLTDYPQMGYNHSSWLDVNRGLLVFADETFNRALKLVDVNDPTDITVTDVFRSKLLAPMDTASIAHNPFIRDNYAIVSYYHDGIVIFDMTDSSNVVSVAHYDTQPDNTDYIGFTGAWGAYPYLPSQRILGSDVTNGLFVLRATDIDFNPIDVTVFPPEQASEIFIFGDANVCAGDTVELLVTADGFDVTWTELNTGVTQTGEIISVQESGTYTTTIADGHCVLEGTDTMTVLITEFPSGTLSVVDEQSVICPGDSTTIVFNGDAQNISWAEGGTILPGETDTTLTVVSAGAYSAILSNGDCAVTLDPELIEEYVVEPIGLNFANVFSEDFTAFIQTDTTALTNIEFFVLDPQTGDTIALDNGGFASVLVDYNQYFDTEIFVTALDGNGCKVFANEILFFESTTDLLQSTDWQLAPNPSRDQFHLSYSGADRPDFEYRLFDLHGKLIESGRLNGYRRSFDLSGHPAGTYSLLLQNASESLRAMLVKL